ncbi:hypothetical protein [Bdellovibrio bacteriovorus]|uniref:hypothetical protein n=1 Tax=Bdellovibrio bacteriovorus TaxID=959 RepID=UPI003AA931B5
MISFYKIPEQSLPYVIVGGLHEGIFFVEREGCIQNVAMTLLAFSDMVGDIKLKSFSDSQLPLRNNQDWDHFLSNIDSQIEELEDCCQNAAKRLERVSNLTEDCLTERPTQSMGYLITKQDGKIDSGSTVLMSLSAFKSLFYKAYPHMYEAC